MKREQLNEMYKKYNLDKSNDFFKHQHYTIITRSGIDKIQAKAGISINYEVIKCEKDFCVVKASGIHEKAAIETFGSALKGNQGSGNCNTWYVMEMAEKRAMSRAVLKLTGFYELGVFGEDESEDFKRKPAKKKVTDSREQQWIDWAAKETDVNLLMENETKLKGDPKNAKALQAIQDRINELLES